MSTDDTPAVDRADLAKVLYDESADLALTRLGAEAMADAVIASGILRDVREVQHEARQQICAAIEAITSSVDGDVEWLNREFVLAAIDDPDTKFLAAAMAYARAQERHADALHRIRQARTDRSVMTEQKTAAFTWVSEVPIPSQFVAKCTCGWRGFLRHAEATAIADRAEHKNRCPDRNLPPHPLDARNGGAS